MCQSGIHNYPHSSNQSFHATCPLLRSSRHSSLTSITTPPHIKPIQTHTHSHLKNFASPLLSSSSSSYVYICLSFLIPKSQTYDFEHCVCQRKPDTDMSTADDSTSATNTTHVKSPPPPADEAPPSTPGGGSGVSRILRRWKREDMIKRGSLGLRGIAVFFSLVSFIVMASNKHGDWRQFDRYEEYRYNIFWEFRCGFSRILILIRGFRSKFDLVLNWIWNLGINYRYVLAVAILSTLYTGAQFFRQLQELSTGKYLLHPKTASFVDFWGDQVWHFLL